MQSEMIMFDRFPGKVVKFFFQHRSYCKAKMHKFHFGLGCTAKPLGENSPDPLAGFKGPTSSYFKGEEGMGRNERSSEGEILSNFYSPQNGRSINTIQ